MRTGKLRHLIEIQRFERTFDEEGAPVQAWITIATVWASIEPLKGDEFFAALQTQAKVSHKVTMRGLPSGSKPRNTDRLLFKGREFDIQAVLDTEERGVELVLMCEEKV